MTCVSSDCFSFSWFCSSAQKTLLFMRWIFLLKVRLRVWPSFSCITRWGISSVDFLVQTNAFIITAVVVYNTHIAIVRLPISVVFSFTRNKWLGKSPSSWGWRRQLGWICADTGHDNTAGISRCMGNSLGLSFSMVFPIFRESHSASSELLRGLSLVTGRAARLTLRGINRPKIDLVPDWDSSTMSEHRVRDLVGERERSPGCVRGTTGGETIGAETSI